MRSVRGAIRHYQAVSPVLVADGTLSGYLVSSPWELEIETDSWPSSPLEQSRYG